MLPVFGVEGVIDNSTKYVPYRENHLPLFVLFMLGKYVLYKLNTMILIEKVYVEMSKEFLNLQFQ